MSAAGVIVGLWVLFALTHMGLSSRAWRPRLVATLGAQGFLAAYSVLAIAIFTALVWFYMVHRHEGVLLWTPSLGTAGLWAIYMLQGVAWVLVVAGVLSPSPATVGTPEAGEARGVHLLTRHPLFMGAGLFGALHLFVRLRIRRRVLGGLPALRTDRLRAPGPPQGRDRNRRVSRLASTHAIPAIHGTRDAARLRETPPLAIAIGVALATGLRLLHAPLFH